MKPKPATTKRGACACGRPATQRRNGCYACDRCIAIEKRLAAIGDGSVRGIQYGELLQK